MGGVVRKNIGRAIASPMFFRMFRSVAEDLSERTKGGRSVGSGEGGGGGWATERRVRNCDGGTAMAELRWLRA